MGELFEQIYDLRLYLVGQTPASLQALGNLTKICEQHLQGHYHIEVVDLLQNPQHAKTDQITAVPTLVRKPPGTFRKIIGNMSNTERVLAGLGILQHAAAI